MTAQYFNRQLFLILLVASIVFVGFNLWFDVYGLFGSTVTQKPVYTNERTAKFLLAKNYIPSYFDGIVLGPSLSANMQMENFSVGNFYNASVMGANISELKLIAEKIVATKAPKYAIICLDPYMVKDAGRKTTMIDEKEFYGAFGSTFLLKTYAIGAVREFNLLPSKFPKDVIHADGFNDFNKEYNWTNPQKHIDRKLATNEPIVYPINPTAKEDLMALLATFRQSHTQVLAYFSPVPAQLMQRHESDYKLFQQQILNCFTHDDIIVDFNTKEFAPFTHNLENYIDHGHLSLKGQAFVSSQLNLALVEGLK